MKTTSKKLLLLGGFFLLSFSLFYTSCSIPCEFNSDTLVGTWMTTDQMNVSFEADGTLVDDALLISTLDASMVSTKSWAISANDELILTEERLDGTMNFITLNQEGFDCGYLTLEGSNGRVELFK